MSEGQYLYTRHVGPTPTGDTVAMCGSWDATGTPSRDAALDEKIQAERALHRANQRMQAQGGAADIEAAPASPFTRLYEACERLEGVEQRLTMLTERLVGPWPETAKDRPAQAGGTMGLCGALDEMADRTQQRLERLHAMLARIERVLP